MKSNTKAFLMALMLSMSVSACSWKDAVSTVGALTGTNQEKPLVGVDTEVGDDTVVVGDTVENTTGFDEAEISGDVQVNNHQERNTVDTAREVTYNEFSPLVMIIIAFLSVFGAVGWLAPSAKELFGMWRNRGNKNDEK